MDKEVLITIKSSQTLGGVEDDGSELITQGKYSFTPDGVRFSYMESEITGLDGTQTDFFVTPGEVIMSREGTVTSRMIFHRGKKHHFMYETPYGTLTMGLDTHRIASSLDEHGGSMEIEYDIDFDRAVVSHNRFNISVREKTEKELRS